MHVPMLSFVVASIEYRTKTFYTGISGRLA